MPDYGEAAIKAGWVQEGAKWKHKAKPGVVRYNAKQIWDEDITDDSRDVDGKLIKRPISVTKPEPPAEVKKAK